MKTAAHQYEDKLLELAYGELPAPEASAVESHVRTCARCSDALAQIQAVRNTMGQLPIEPVPDTGLESLFAYAEQAARRNAAGPAPTATWWRKLMAPLMAAGALSVIGVVAYQANRDGAPLASKAEIAERGARDERKSEPKPQAVETVTAAPVAVAEAPPAPAPSEPAAQPAVWNQEEANKEANREAEKTQVAQRELAAPAKVAPKPVAAKKMAGPTLGDDIARAASLDEKQSKNERKKAEEEAPPKAIANYADVGASTGRAAQPVADKAEKADPAGSSKGKAKDNADLDSLGYGLKQGNAGGATPRTPPPAEQRAEPPPPPPMQAQAPATESRTSLGLGLQQQKRPVVSASGGSLAEGQAELAKDDAPAAAARPQSQVMNLDAKRKELESARVRRDTATELDIARDLLKVAPTKSAERRRALNSVCTGLNALERYEEAYKYCQALLIEYPNSPEAIAYAESQHRQRPAAAKRSKSGYEADEAKEPPASPAQQQKAEPAKASEAY